MLWIFLSLLAPLFWAMTNLIDGDLVVHRLKNPSLMVGITGLFGGLPGLYFILTSHLVAVPFSVVLLGLVAGAVNLFVYYPYFKALESTHPANAVIFWNLTPVLVAVCAFLFLGERLTWMRYVAIGLILLSTVIIETAKGDIKKHRMEWNAFWWMVLASIGLAAQGLLEKKLFMTTSTSMGIILISSSTFIYGLLFFVKKKERAKLRHVFSKDGAILTLNQFFDLSGLLCTQFAISLGPVSLVSAIGGSQAFFVLALAWIVSKLFNRKQFRLAELPQTDRVIIAGLLVMVGLMMIG